MGDFFELERRDRQEAEHFCNSRERPSTRIELNMLYAFQESRRHRQERRSGGKPRRFGFSIGVDIVQIRSECAFARGAC